MKRIIFGCDTCKTEAEGQKLGIIPAGWTEITFYDYRAGMFRRFCFCCGNCAIQWLESQNQKLAFRRENYYDKETKSQTIGLGTR